MTIELHCHTTASDGARTPAELVAAAQAAGVGILALTDHDTTQNDGETARLCQQAGICFIPGIELSCWNGLESIHILGYFQGEDYADPLLNETLRRFQDKRIQRAHAIAQRLKQHYDITIDVDRLPMKPGTSIGRANLARLIEEAYPLTREEIFRRYLGDHSRAFIPSSDMKPQDGISLLRAAGATVILAHPGELRKTRFSEVFGLAFDGAECYYPNHTPKRTGEFVRACLDRGRLITCGSDDHGLPGDQKHGRLGSTPCVRAHIRPFLHRLGCPDPDRT